MSISPYIRFIFLALLSALLPFVDAKGGGGHPTGENIEKIVTVVNGQQQTQCIDTSTNQLVNCSRSLSAGAVIAIVICLVIILVIMFLVKQHKNKKESEKKTTKVPPFEARKEYRPLITSEQGVNSQKAVV